jgi:hypothetical protein
MGGERVVDSWFKMQSRKLTTTEKEKEKNKKNKSAPTNKEVLETLHLIVNLLTGGEV